PRPPGHPNLGIAQLTVAPKKRLRASSGLPPDRGFADTRMITDPVDIGVECDDQVGEAIGKRAFLGRDKEVKAPQPYRALFGVDGPVHKWKYPLRKPFGFCDLPTANG